MATETTLASVTSPIKKHDQQQALETWIAHARYAKFEAEGTVVQLKELYKPAAPDLVSPERLYRLAAGFYNSILESIVLPLGGAKKVPPDPTSADRDEIQSTYDNFMIEANKLIDAKLPHAGLVPDVFVITSFVPSIADIAKLIDSIFGIFKFFMNRKEEERQFLIGRIDSVMWNQWVDAGRVSAPKSADPSKKEDPKKPSS